jgi:ribosomal protein S18 acetylase RimI-like enzyme
VSTGLPDDFELSRPRPRDAAEVAALIIEMELVQEGEASCVPERFGGGWVGTLGVLPESRGQGIGKALLQRAFASFWERGERRVALAVDAENDTGATRLYESVGMRVAFGAITYEKPLDG